MIEMFKEAGCFFHGNPTSMLWREIDGRTVGGFAWSNYDGGTIQAHIAGERGWLNRKMLYLSYEYPFDQLGVKVILAFLPDHRVQARKVAQSMGFKELGMIPGVDLHLMTLVRKDCEKWLALPSRGWNG